MRILTVVYNLEKGGTQRAAQVFAEAYRNIGHDSKILSLYGLGIRYHEIKDYIDVYDGVNEENLRLIKQWQPNVIHIHSHGPKHEDINKILDNVDQNHVKVVETNVFSRPSPWADKVKISFQLSDWANWLFKLKGGNKYLSTVVPNPIKCNTFSKVDKLQVVNFKKKYGIPADALVIGRIGQHFSGKWSLMLVEVFNELALENTNLYLVIVNPPMILLDKLKSSLFKDRVIHIASIAGDEDLKSAYSSFDFMLHIAEQGESFGMVLAESILCQTPVITLSTPWGDNSQIEVVENNVCGLVVHTKKGVKKAIEHIIKNKNIKDTFKHGSKSIKDRYDYLTIAQLALDYAMDKKLVKAYSKELTSDLIDLLDNSFEPPDSFTKMLIKKGCKHFTRYSTGYESCAKIPERIVKKIFRKCKFSRLCKDKKKER